MSNTNASFSGKKRERESKRERWRERERGRANTFEMKNGCDREGLFGSVSFYMTLLFSGL